MMEKSTENNSVKRAVIALVVAAVLAIAGVFAYLTATDTAVNKLSVGQDIDIEVVEPNWVEEDAQGMLPTQEVAKDPAIHNLSGHDIWVFADVVIPTKDMVVVGADGHKMPQAVTDVFTYELNPGWTLKDTIQGDGTVTYRYAYDSSIAGDATTGSIFDKVKVCNYVDGQFQSETGTVAQNIVINGYGVQASAFDSVDKAYADYFGSNAIALSELTVKSDAIVKDEAYEVVALEANNSVANSTAVVDDEVTFTSLSLEKNTDYVVIPEGENVSTKVAEFTTDENFTDEIADGKTTVEAPPVVVANIPVAEVAIHSSNIVYGDSYQLVRYEDDGTKTMLSASNDTMTGLVYFKNVSSLRVPAKYDVEQDGVSVLGKPFVTDSRFNEVLKESSVDSRKNVQIDVDENGVVTNISIYYNTAVAPGGNTGGTTGGSDVTIGTGTMPSTDLVALNHNSIVAGETYQLVNKSVGVTLEYTATTNGSVNISISEMKKNPGEWILYKKGELSNPLATLNVTA